jgi:hypothetical protein
MSVNTIKGAINAQQSELQVKKVKTSHSIVIKLDLTDEREKQISEDFLKIKEASKFSECALAIELIEEGIAQLATQLK